MFPTSILSVTLIVILALKDTTAIKKPNIILFLADDFGWGNVGFHREDDTKEVQTPVLDSLAKDGVILDRFYAFRICSPSRCSLQSGRLPVHVNTINIAPEVHNPHDQVSGYAGIPKNMTCLAEKLKKEGYSTVMSGKWDAGMATPTHTPKGRGYDKFLGYFHHANSYWTCGVPFTAVGEVDVCHNRFLDLWQNDGPARELAGAAYEEELFESHSIEAIINHYGKPNPLFLFHSFHLLHTPLELPEKDLEPFKFIDYENRRKYAAMTYYMDRTIGRIVQTLKDFEMYENSLIVFFSDNGGPIYFPASASNYPHRGGKYSDFEGGVRVNALAAGGVIPTERRGSVSSNFLHVADMYASFIRLAHFGIDGSVNKDEFSALLHDERAAAAGLPPVDSLDTLWDAIKGNDKQARNEIHLSSQALIVGKYKLITGDQPMNIYQGPSYPNATGSQPPFRDIDVFKKYDVDCGPAGCLYNIFNDPGEHNDLALKEPEIRREILERLEELNKSEFKPNRGKPSRRACSVAQRRHKGFYGPFLELKNEFLENESELTSDMVVW